MGGTRGREAQEGEDVEPGSGWRHNRGYASYLASAVAHGPWSTMDAKYTPGLGDLNMLRSTIDWPGRAKYNKKTMDYTC